MNTNKYIHMLSKEKHRKATGLNPLSPQWSRQAVDTGGKILSNLLFVLLLYFLDPDPHLASVVCVLHLFSVSRYELCVCGNLCTCVRVSKNLESPPTMGNFKV